MALGNKNVNFKVSVTVNGQKQVADLEMSMEDLADITEAVTTESRKLKGALNETMVNMAAMSTVINSVASATESLSRGYASFDRSMRAVNTMAGNNEAEFVALKNHVRDLAASIPMARDALADGLYQVISNGVPEDNWISYLDKSAKASIGGIADLGKTVTVTSTVIKNYGLAWESAGEIQDKIQLTAKNGVTSFEQLADALPRVTGNAVALGVPIDELLASFATLTGVSGNTAEVSTQLAAIFTALIKPSSEAAETAEAMGIQFNAASIKAAGGMKAFLSNLDTAVKSYAESSGILEQEVYGRLFGSAESLRAIGPLTGQLAETFDRNVSLMADSAGTVDSAFGEMSGTSDAVAQRLENLIFKLTDTAGCFASKINPVLQFTATIGQVGIGVNTLIPMFGSLKSGARAATVAIRGMGIGMKSLLIGTGVGIAIVALTSAIEWLVAKSDDAADSLDGLSGKISALDHAQEECDRTVSRTTAALDYEAARLRVLMNANIDTAGAVEELNNRYGAVFGNHKTAAGWLDILTTKTKNYAEMLGYQQKMQALGVSAAETGINIDRTKEAIAKWEADNRNKMRAGRKDKVTGLTEFYSNDEEWKTLQDNLQAYRNELVNIQCEQERVVKLTEKLQKDSGIVMPSFSGTTPQYVPKHGLENPGENKAGMPPAGTEAYYKKLAQDIESRLAGINIELEPVAYQNLVAQLVDVRNIIDGLERNRKTVEMDLKFPDVDKTAYSDIFPEKIDVLANFDKSTASDAVLPDTAVYDPVLRKQEELRKSMEHTKSVAEASSLSVGAIGSIFGSLSSIVGDCAGAFLEWGANVLQAVSQAIPAIAQLVGQQKMQANANAEAAATGAAASVASIPIVGWLMAGAAVASVIAAFAGIPKFAEGGIAYGPTLGLFGEYAGASNNPEVVAPLDRLRSLLRPVDGNGGVVRFKIDGRTLVGILEKETNIKKRG